MSSARALRTARKMGCGRQDESPGASRVNNAYHLKHYGFCAPRQSCHLELRVTQISAPQVGPVQIGALWRSENVGGVSLSL